MRVTTKFGTELKFRGALLDGNSYTGAGKSLARPGSKQATATEVFDSHISYL